MYIVMPCDGLQVYARKFCHYYVFKSKGSLKSHTVLSNFQEDEYKILRIYKPQNLPRLRYYNTNTIASNINEQA